MEAVLPTIFNNDPDSAENIKSAMMMCDEIKVPNGNAIIIRSSLQVVLSNLNAKINCELVKSGFCYFDGVSDMPDIGGSDTPDDGGSDTPDDGGLDTPDDGGSDMPDNGGSGTPNNGVSNMPNDAITAPPGVINLEDVTPIPFVTSNYIGDRSAIALDVKQTQLAISADNFQGATQIYNNGCNSKIYNKLGVAMGELKLLTCFSMESAITMKSDPTHNHFIYGLSDDNQEFMGQTTTVYADTLILNLMVLKVPEVQTAMVAITIWMQVIHSLHSAYGACHLAISEERSGFSERN
jgi:hypothetical protein